MGTLIKVSGLDLLGKDGAFVVPPVSANLELFHLLRQAAVKSTKNLAKNKLNSAVVGALDYTDSYTIFNGVTQKIVTQVADTANFTFYIVCKSPVIADSNRPTFLSNMNTPPANTGLGAGNIAGVTMTSVRESGAGHVAFGACIGTTIANSSQSVLGFSSSELSIHNWHLYMLRSNELNQTFKSFTANLEKNATYTNPRLVGSRPLSIGGLGAATGGTSNGENHIACVAMYSSAHSDEQAHSVADFIKNIMLNVGITV